MTTLEWLLLAVVVVLGLGFLYLLSIRRPAPASFHESDPSPAAIPGMKGSALRFRAGIYNIHRCKGVDRKRDTRRIADTIGNVDVAGLCEVAGPVPFLRQNQAAILAEHLGMQGVFSPTQRRWCRDDRGNGLLTRLPLIRAYHEPLVDRSGNRARVLSTYELDAGGTPVFFLVTHLARRIDQDIQLDVVFRRFCQYEHAVLVGDFNVKRGFVRLDAFLNSGQGLDAVGQAMGGEDDVDRIDWILTRGMRVLQGGMTPVGPSDHPYYWVELELEGPQGV